MGASVPGQVYLYLYLLLYLPVCMCVRICQFQSVYLADLESFIFGRYARFDCNTLCGRRILWDIHKNNIP